MGELLHADYGNPGEKLQAVRDDVCLVEINPEQQGKDM
jgi:hypothetical protein